MSNFLLYIFCLTLLEIDRMETYLAKQPCEYWFVTLDPATSEPLTETLRNKPSNKFDTDYTTCNEGRVPNTQMKAPAGKHQCFPKSGLRYFYKVSIQTGAIIPPMWSQQGKPNNMCSGTNNILEYKIFG